MVSGVNPGAVIMLGTLFGVVVIVFALVLRYDPDAPGRFNGRGGD